MSSGRAHNIDAIDVLAITGGRGSPGPPPPPDRYLKVDRLDAISPPSASRARQSARATVYFGEYYANNNNHNSNLT